MSTCNFLQKQPLTGGTLPPKNSMRRQSSAREAVNMKTPSSTERPPATSPFPFDRIDDWYMAKTYARLAAMSMPLTAKATMRASVNSMILAMTNRQIRAWAFARITRVK